MKRHIILSALTLACITGSWAGKQKIIVRLREPLKAETVKIRLPEVKNAKGETRDLETRLELGVKPKQEAPNAAAAALKLNMAVRSLGRNAVQVTLTLPNPGFVEVVILDFYGKNLATLLSGHMPSGVYPLKPFVLKEGDLNGIKFMTLRINGRMVMKRMMSKVR
jgi:hypothetical protein